MTVSAASGFSLSLDRGRGRPVAREQRRADEERVWQVLGASRGEGGILGEGVRQALLRDPTYGPALDSGARSSARNDASRSRCSRTRPRLRGDAARARSHGGGTSCSPAARRRGPRTRSSLAPCARSASTLGRRRCGSATSVACRPTTSARTTGWSSSRCSIRSATCRHRRCSGSRRARARRRRPTTTSEQLREAGRREFDLVLLGIGPDGHTASLFPDQATLSERSRLVVGVPEAGLEPFVPRVSLTLPALAPAQADRVPGHRRVEGGRGRGGVRAGRRARSPRSGVAAGAACASEITVLLDPRCGGGGGVVSVTAVIGVDLGGTKVAVAALATARAGRVADASRPSCRAARS